MPKSNLHVIRSAPAGSPQPPGKLGVVGLSIWTAIVAEFEFDNRASLETLFQACSAADRAEACRQQIEADGVVLKTRTGLRDHPLIKHEIAARALCVRTLARLGCDLEPLHSGRPPTVV